MQQPQTQTVVDDRTGEQILNLQEHVGEGVQTARRIQFQQAGREFPGAALASDNMVQYVIVVQAARLNFLQNAAVIPIAVAQACIATGRAMVVNTTRKLTTTLPDEVVRNDLFFASGAGGAVESLQMLAQRHTGFG